MNPYVQSWLRPLPLKDGGNGLVEVVTRLVADRGSQSREIRHTAPDILKVFIVSCCVTLKLNRRTTARSRNHTFSQLQDRNWLIAADIEDLSYCRLVRH
jgi:hypothetical protein